MVNYTECAELLYVGVIGKGDADISGPGVISAFIASAYLTLFAILGAYFFGLVDSGLLGPVDRLIMGIPSRAQRHPRAHVTLRKAIMATSDQQIVTGIAILAAGFQGLRTGHMSVYHFQVVIYLAWMSSSVHLSALTLLRPFMHHHRGVLVWRVVGMMVLLVMLFVALVPTVSNDWAVLTVSDDNNPAITERTAMGVPAICFWGQLYGDGANPDAVLSFLLLMVSYIWKMGGLFEPFRGAWQKCFRHPVDRLLETPLCFLAKRHELHRTLFWLLAYQGWLIFYLNTTAALEVLDSFSAALWLSALGAIYGTMQILIPRALVQAYTPSIQAQEEEFGFGQLVALVLLVQPLGSVMEHLWLKGEEEERVYLAHRGSDSANGILDLFDEKGEALQQLRRESLSGVLSAYTMPAWQEDSAARMQLKALLYTSRTFKLLVWFVHFGIMSISIVLFTIDSFVIGYTTADNWFSIGASAAAFVGCASILGAVILPFSRLSRARIPSRRSTKETEGSDDAQELEGAATWRNPALASKAHSAGYEWNG